MSQINAVPVWPDNAYLRPIAVATGGLRAYTHLANVHPPGGTPCRAYIKHFPEAATKGLFNEWFGYTLMRAMGVPQPAAAIMRAPVFGHPDSVMAWAFVSCEATPTYDGTPKQRYNIDDPKQHAQLVKRLFDCDQIPLLIAADQMLMNDDRNLGNLVFTGKKSFVAIDHGCILGGDAWQSADLWFTAKWVNSKLLSDRLVPIANHSPTLRSSVCACAELVSEQYFAVQTELRLALESAQNPDVCLALDAVWWRCLPIAQWFKSRLRLLV